ncbi:MAG: 5-(carboxyamino)imidazole ribonucleotide mutase [Firmicutes bacterium HGW-Firmicutes-15]|nr:MAG: 5-(carboxyamino)imidazole ribonucleotide mutase [Firmicutes bacterium HGW-Firmicutes-15]
MPTVGIIMGSDSDLPIMKEAVDVLEQFGVDYDLTVCSAHRLPKETAEYALTVAECGVEVIIAGAGGAAHLPGVIAAYTILPVIGVPIKTSTLSGVDSLYSIVQMPKGIPVATVAINGSANAALLALQILALKDESLREKLMLYRQKMAEDVLEKDRKLKDFGIEKYLQQKGDQ